MKERRNYGMMRSTIESIKKHDQSKKIQTMVYDYAIAKVTPEITIDGTFVKPVQIGSGPGFLMVFIKVWDISLIFTDSRHR